MQWNIWTFLCILRLLRLIRSDINFSFYLRLIIFIITIRIASNKWIFLDNLIILTILTIIDSITLIIFVGTIIVICVITCILAFLIISCTKALSTTRSCCYFLNILDLLVVLAQITISVATIIIFLPFVGS